ncbi:hypothetical protein SAMN04487846_2261 [Microbacterium sp. cf046]|nr:hypothetical protein SAMN04487846_2261 [Microbacterium sp. cf046]
MRAFLLRFIQDPKHPDGITVPPENQREFLMLFGLIQRVRRLTQAYLRLERDGFLSEGSVLVRAALEHAVIAQWAYLTPGGIDRLHVSLAIAQADVAKSMMAYSKDPEWVTLEQHLRGLVPPGAALPKFSGKDAMMTELDSIKFLAASYRVLSQVGHVTHQAALDFVTEDQGVVRLRTNPESMEQDHLLYALCGFCMLVAWLHARLEADEEEVLRLKEMSVRLHLPWRLDTHMPRDRRRFPDEDNDDSAASEQVD